MKKLISFFLTMVAIAVITIVMINLPDRYYEHQDAKLYGRIEEYPYEIQLNGETMTLTQKLTALAADDTMITMNGIDDEEFVTKVHAHLDELADEVEKVLIYPNTDYVKTVLTDLKERIGRGENRPVYHYEQFLEDTQRDYSYCNTTQEIVLLSELQAARVVDDNICRFNLGYLKDYVICPYYMGGAENGLVCIFFMEILFDLDDYKILGFRINSSNDPLWLSKYRDTQIRWDDYEEETKYIEGSWEKFMEYYGDAIGLMYTESLPGQVQLSPLYDASKDPSIHRIEEMVNRYGRCIVNDNYNYNYDIENNYNIIQD